MMFSTFPMLQLASVVLTALATASVDTECSRISSCSECIGSVSCIWCSTPGSAHCFSQQDTDKLLACKDIVDPQNSITVKQLPLDEFDQVSVESVQMKLRVEETLNFTVSIRSAKNFPLDLYMLIDFSRSFDDDLESARDTAEDIVLPCKM